MKVSYRITEDDYVAAIKLGAVPTRKKLLLLLALFAGLILLGLFGGPILQGAAIGGFCSGVVVYLVGQFVYVPWLGRRNYRKYKAIQQEQWVELLAEGIEVSSATSRGVVTWENVLKWRESEGLVLVYVMPRLFYIVKKGLVGEGFDVEALRGELLAGVGAAEIAK